MSGPHLDRAFVFTCEHAVNHIAPRYRRYLLHRRKQLDSHQGFDVGALALAQDFARTFQAPLIAGTQSRLLVDLNRSLGHRDLHAEEISNATPALREEILLRYYYPYRAAATDAIRQALGRSKHVVHISVHSFTPKLDGVERRADIGLLYDPARAMEKRLVQAWQQTLRDALPDLIIRRNYPYTGKSDGFTTALRRQFADREYAGIEIELNQKHVLVDARVWRALRKKLVTLSLAALK